jgi:hypothetical protein
MEATWSSGALADFQRLYGVVTQKIELLITTAERTSIPSSCLFESCKYKEKMNSIPSEYRNVVNRNKN